MKFLPVFAGALISTAAALTCEEGKVPDANSMCIQPRYIEGCAQYATTSTCQKCEFSTFPYQP